MEKNYWTAADIKLFFKIEERGKSISTVYNAENRGEIPTAERVTRGKVQARQWPIKDIPSIGEKIGFLTKNKSQKVICKYIQKGGVLKTTTTFNEARVLALNGIKTLVIGLDFECSITDIIKPREEIQKLEEGKNYSGLYHFFYQNASINDIICKTSLPTLDIIPETHDLVVLEKALTREQRRENIFKTKLLPKLKEYDVIFFDNGPSWNHLIENALNCSDVIICPLGCNLLSYNASQTNFSSIIEFQKSMELKNQQIIMYATLLERTSLSQQIFAQYLSTFSEYIIDIPIRASVKGQEALVTGQSMMEYAPRNPLAMDFYELFKKMWTRITGEPGKQSEAIKAGKKALSRAEALLEE